MSILIKLAWMIPTAIIVFIIFFQSAKHVERKNFNDGVCKCGGRFKPFDLAVFIGSDGSRGYSCDKCDKTVFCSYDVDTGYRYNDSL